ncbi:MAG TPA: acyl-CoA thioesterase [Puia sp.]|nr:acyl-CoA thioesterase [Puia sp.]
MEELQKTWESKYLIRFPDCDPFNHLNNSRYLDYFINAREDHLMKFHHFNIYELARDKGISWVVSKNEIAYLRPALLMETVIIQTSLIRIDDQEITVEMSMWNLDKTILKAFLWSTFVHFNLITQRREKHSAELLHAFVRYSIDLPESVRFDERLEILKESVRIK